MKPVKRVLVVDNDKDVLKSVEFNLSINGYDVLAAESMEEAKALLRQEIVHVAIIDVRLEHEKRPDDQSGFDLARLLPDHIPFVIFSAYEDKEIAKHALRDLSAIESLDKKSQTDANRLIDVIDRAFSQEVNVNFDLKIEAWPNLQEIAELIETEDEAVAPTAEDVQQILRTLLHEADKLSLMPLVEPEKRALSATPSGSVVLKVRPYYPQGPGELLVIKLGKKETIKQEIENYHRIRRFLGGHRLAILEGPEAYSRSIGGIAYRLIGASHMETVYTFDKVFQERPADDLTGLLEIFFEQTFGSIFQNARRETVNLVEIYARPFKLTPARLRDALKKLRPGAWHSPKLRFKGLDTPLINPLSWTLQDEETFAPQQTTSWICLCHGDLHSQNILVDASGQFWLIDFARSTESHAVRDFVELENNIKFELLPEVKDPQTLVDFEQSLLAPTSFGEPASIPAYNDQQLDKAHRVILKLREIAGQLLPLESGELHDYYRALLFDTLKILCIKHIDPAQKRHALLAAALICQHLEE